MTYKIYFIERTKAQLCRSVHTTTSQDIMEIIRETGEDQGFEVRIEAEG
jgi:hypothetical protein